MEYDFDGHYSIAVEANRVRIPTAYREVLGDKFSVTPGEHGCFYIMATEMKKVIFADILNVPAIGSTVEKKMFARKFRFLCKEITLDAQGRMTITNEMTDTCTALKRPFDTLIFCGMGDYIEVWTQHAFDKVFDKKVTSDDIDELIAKMQSQLDGSDSAR